MIGPWLTYGAFVIACNIASSMAMAVPEEDTPLRVVSTGMNQFATDFYKKTSDEVEDNLICSPISAGIVLAMTAYGARENTENQMRSGLHMPEDLSVGKSGYQSIIDKLNDVKKVQLHVANKIFTADGLEVKPEFKELTENSFRSAAQKVDFTKADEASQTINAWCEEKTHNRIKDVVKPDDVKDAAIVLVNAVYFKGNWETKFDPALTAPKPFHIDDKTTNDVPMMFKHSRFNYGELPELDAKYVELKYESENEDDSTSMFIILPNEINGLKNAENNLQSVDFKSLHDNGYKSDVLLYLPKFKIETTIGLQGILEKMGMGEMFTDKANFSGITDSPPLTISKVIQKAFIEVNEEGSEAAAVTVVVGMTRTAMNLRPEPITMRVDKPFIYAIVHNAANVILFQGHILRLSS